MKRYVFINHGKKIVSCPVCGCYTEVEEGQKKFICMSEACYHLAREATYLQRRVVNGAERFYPVPDQEARQAEMDRARKNGDEYEVIWPSNYADLMAVLRLRNRENMHWYPKECEQEAFALSRNKGNPNPTGQSIADLLAENELLGVK